ncbi:hypothetical protein [Sulfurivermis fontis]|jgi:hypothetical protein|uniref:hypothetical protein n=1 Tax=Sulfurivermis fontis TaxID=1972068 RepID=UPI000FD7079F|nr:hypothetical protein [Sulfurivermis fontis]
MVLTVLAALPGHCATGGQAAEGDYSHFPGMDTNRAETMIGKGDLAGGRRFSISRRLLPPCGPENEKPGLCRAFRFGGEEAFI